MDNLATFKMEIEAMFEKSFQELSQKNNLNKAILGNLMEAANQQSKRIGQLDQNIQSLKRTSTPNITTIRNQITAQEKLVHDNFDAMMMRLCQIEEGVSQAKKNADTNIQINRESEQSLNELLKQIEKMQKEEGIPEYHGNRDQLSKQVEEFEKMLDEETERMKNNLQSLQAGKKTSLQPLQTFETKIAIHNKNNEEILKNKLRNFSQRLKKVEKKIEQATWSMNNEVNKAKTEQKKIIQDMNNVEKQMGKIRQQLQIADQRRKQEIQSSAATLDNMVEEMLAETKKLEVRVDNLKKGYEEQTQKMRSR